MFLLLAALTIVSSSTAEYSETNPCSQPWLLWRNGSCKCGSSLDGIVTCTDDPVSVELESCYCMTADGHTRETVVGSCPYSCASPVKWYPNQTELDYHMCNETWKRTGLLCSQCMDDHGPLVYSYSMQCIPCSPDVVRDSVVLFLVSFLPLTVFCLAIITLRISGARPPMSTFILVSQVMAAPQYLTVLFTPQHRISYIYRLHVEDSQREMCWKLFASFFGLWNLDIFRAFYPQMCLNPNMSTLQAHFLEYLIAVFPLAILLVVYACVHLYNRYRVIFCLCRPITSALARIRQTIDIRTSLVDAFATFIILSVIKVGYTSLIILQPVFVYSPLGNHTVKVYTDPTLPYFGWHHLPYALTALVLTIVLILIPLLLLFLYPLRSFQTFLNNHHWQCSTLHIFADTFQGCYKNGTNGTRDYRWFAGLHLLMRFIIIFFLDVSRYHKTTVTLQTVTVALYTTMLVTCQPYKNNIYLKLDITVLFGLLLWTTAVMTYGLESHVTSSYTFVFHLILVILATLVTFVYFIGLLVYWALCLKRLHLRAMIMLVAATNRNGHITNP